MKVITLNCHNLFLDDPSHKDYKDHSKVYALASMIKKEMPDIVLMQEVGGDKSLQIFCEKFLDGLYIHTLIEGNSDRGIEVGYIIKNNKNYGFEHYTHKNRSISFNYPYEQIENEVAISRGGSAVHPSHKFSRDASELRVYKNKKLILILLNVHLKSKKDRDGHDEGGVLRRGAEAKTLYRIHNALLEKYSVPVLIGGDFNGELSEAEFQVFTKNGIRDVQDYLNIPKEERFTILHFTRDKRREFYQFDHLLIHEQFQDLIKKRKECVLHYIKDGKPFVPELPYERFTMPSDHYPVCIEVDV